MNMESRKSANGTARIWIMVIWVAVGGLLLAGAAWGEGHVDARPYIMTAVRCYVCSWPIHGMIQAVLRKEKMVLSIALCAVGFVISVWMTHVFWPN